MRDRLVTIFNALNSVSTKGQDTLVMADCLRELAAIVQDLDKEEEKDGVQ